MPDLFDVNPAARDPQDTEAFKLGAYRIRSLKDTLESLFSMFLDDSAAWKTNVIPGSALTNNSVPGSALTDSSVTAAKIDPTTVGLAYMPTGVILPFAGSAVPSASWIICDGGAVSRTTYAALFAIVGTSYGTGDGSTTFNVPDLRGRVPVGLDNMGVGAASRITGSLPNGSTNPSTTLGGAGGEQKHQLTVAELASHNHSSGTDAFVEAGAGLSAAGSGATSNWGFVGTTANTGSDTPHNNVQPSIFLNYIIRT